MTDTPEVALADAFNDYPQPRYETALRRLAAAGWRLVPVEMTKWMEIQIIEGIEANSAHEVWKRVLKAAPGGSDGIV